ncbi:hypothetical protein HK100_007456 [Physocladia obscura]|uniref:PhzF family phenazine biosynthesis protein n=1 Tax=Physocladia obscura TaxID=109957 RepID=A0AAD5SRQ3_9FUNG|nr:hypothetical protein HK100_007456 [Physocladia obscura]
MVELRYRVVNVFVPSDATDVFSGNALAVFEDGRLAEGSEAEVTNLLQGLARQLNLSETTFLLDAPTRGERRVRIFTSNTELPFAGHPTLGSAFAAHALDGECHAVHTGAGRIAVANYATDARRALDGWRLNANRAVFAPPLPPPQLAAVAAMAGFAPADLVPADIPVVSVNTGIWQLMAQVASVDALNRASVPHVAQMESLGCKGVLYFVLDKPSRTITSRFFFKEPSAVLEDPGTGSACANLGRLLQREGLRGVFKLSQGHALQRLCEIIITIDDTDVTVGGRVVEVGSGVFRV